MLLLDPEPETLSISLYVYIYIHVMLFLSYIYICILSYMCVMVCMYDIYIYYRHIIRIQMSEVFWTGADFFRARALDRGKDEDRIGI